MFYHHQLPSNFLVGHTFNLHTTVNGKTWTFIYNSVIKGAINKLTMKSNALYHIPFTIAFVHRSTLCFNCVKQHIEISTCFESVT